MDKEVIRAEAKRLKISEDEVRNAVATVMVGRPPPPLFFELGFDVYLYLSDFLDLRTLQSLCRTHRRFAEFCNRGYNGESIYYRKLDQLIGIEKRREFVTKIKWRHPNISPLEVYIAYQQEQEAFYRTLDMWISAKLRTQLVARMKREYPDVFNNEELSKFLLQVYTVINDLKEYEWGFTELVNPAFQRPITLSIGGIQGPSTEIRIEVPATPEANTVINQSIFWLNPDSEIDLAVLLAKFMLNGFRPSFVFTQPIMCRICNQASKTMCSTCDAEICSEDCFKTHVKTIH